MIFTDLSVIVWNHNMCADFRCVLCGQMHEQPNIAATLTVGDQTNGVIGDICPACLAKGTIGVSQRMREFIKELRNRADDLEDLMESLSKMPDSRWASPADLEHEYLVFCGALKGMDENALRELDLESLRKLVFVEKEEPF